MRSLMVDLGLKDFQAAGIVGNLAYETRGFTALQDINPSGGGLGYGLWTGARRAAFENFAKERGLGVTSEEANYGYLKRELETTESVALRAVTATTSLEEATRVFRDRFARSAVPNYEARIGWATMALQAFRASAAK